MPLVHIQDVVEAIIRVLYAQGLLGARFIAGNSTPTVREFFDMVCDIADLPCLTRDLPDGLVVVTAFINTQLANLTKKKPYMQYELIRLLQDDIMVDGSKAMHELNITSTPIRVAIEDLVAEMREDQRLVETQLVG